MTEGCEVEIAIRPEDVAIQPEWLAPPSAARGIVCEHSFLGNINEYVVALGEGKEELRVQTHPSQQFAIGQRVAVSVAGEGCNLFPRAAISAEAA
jgi:ABC-type Fe3+/spermidine/putrescine transport system ATPase subunit